MPPPPNPDIAPALEQARNFLPDVLAREDFANLLTLLRYAVHGCFAVALYSSVPAREQVVAALRTALAPLPVFEWTYSPLEAEPHRYLNHLTEEQRGERAVVFLYDLERAGTEAWRGLDMQRDYLSARPHGLVFWITPKARGEAIRNAPNFWSQRSGVFDFRISHPDAAQGPRETAWQAERALDVSTDSPDEMARQLRLYQGLLDEYEQAADTPKRTLFDLHTRLARLLYYGDRVVESKQHALAALELARQLDDQQDEANTLRALGDLALREDDLGGARAAYEAALPIFRAIGDRLGEANTYRSFGRLTQDEVWFERAVELHAQIHDSYSVALDNYSWGLTCLNKGDLDRAQALMREVQAIFMRIGLPQYAEMAAQQIARAGQED